MLLIILDLLSRICSKLFHWRNRYTVTTPWRNSAKVPTNSDHFGSLRLGLVADGLESQSTCFQFWPHSYRGLPRSFPRDLGQSSLDSPCWQPGKSRFFLPFCKSSWLISSIKNGKNSPHLDTKGFILVKWHLKSFVGSIHLAWKVYKSEMSHFA